MAKDEPQMQFPGICFTRKNGPEELVITPLSPPFKPLFTPSPAPNVILKSLKLIDL